MTEEQRKMLGWMRASCVWSIVTGGLVLAFLALLGIYVDSYEGSWWLYMAVLGLLSFGGMQIVDGLVRLNHLNKIVQTLEDSVESALATDVTDSSAELRGRIR